MEQPIEDDPEAKQWRFLGADLPLQYLRRNTLGDLVVVEVELPHDGIKFLKAVDAVLETTNLHIILRHVNVIEIKIGVYDIEWLQFLETLEDITNQYDDILDSHLLILQVID
jgi:hypothetical protein